jgi:hypothetical protein
MTDIIEPEQHDSPLRWLVPSDTEGGVTYLVDVSANGGVGECQCRGFQITCKGQMERKESTCARCKHIRKVREILRKKLFDGVDPLDIVIKMMKDKDLNNEV